MNVAIPDSFEELFGRRLELLLNEAEKSGAYLAVNKDEFDAMEREALILARTTAGKSPDLRRA